MSVKNNPLWKGSATFCVSAHCTGKCCASVFEWTITQIDTVQHISYFFITQVNTAKHFSYEFIRHVNTMWAMASSSLARILGECSTIHSSPARCCFFLFLFVCLLFLIEISSRTLIPLFCQDQSTVAQRAQTTVTECSLTSCLWVRFPW